MKPQAIANRVTLLAALLAVACDATPPVEAPSARRYRIRPVELASGEVLLRIDTASCRLWQALPDRTHWRPIGARFRAPGELDPPRAGRYRLTHVGSAFACADGDSGRTWRMHESGRGGWVLVEEPVHDAGLIGRVAPEELHVEASEVSPPESTGSAEALGQVVLRDDLPAEMRAFAAEKLGGSGSSATDALVRGLGDPDPAVVVAAIRALELNGDPRAVPALRELLDHSDEEVRESAAESLRQLRGRPSP